MANKFQKNGVADCINEVGNIDFNEAGKLFSFNNVATVHIHIHENAERSNNNSESKMNAPTESAFTPRQDIKRPSNKDLSVKLESERKIFHNPLLAFSHILFERLLG